MCQTRKRIIFLILYLIKNEVTIHQLYLMHDGKIILAGEKLVHRLLQHLASLASLLCTFSCIDQRILIHGPILLHLHCSLECWFETFHVLVENFVSIVGYYRQSHMTQQIVVLWSIIHLYQKLEHIHNLFMKIWCLIIFGHFN